MATVRIHVVASSPKSVRMKTRPLRTHWKPRPHARFTQCGRRLRHYAEYNVEYVTCLVCLYHLGRYVPLSKLREHQAQQVRNVFEDWYQVWGRAHRRSCIR